MAITEKKLPYVVLRGELSGTGFVVPFNINACVFFPLPVCSARVMFLKCGKEMLCMTFANIFNAKIIDG